MTVKIVTISIHALRKESDVLGISALCEHGLFQSTLSVRRATWSLTHSSMTCLAFQSTLSVRRATAFLWMPCAFPLISIHALRKESDCLMLAPMPESHDTFQSTLSVRRATAARPVVCSHEKFQSTLSVRRATVAYGVDEDVRVISIHALRKESDSSPSCSLRGVERFQSTLSVRRATVSAINKTPKLAISIHALRKESDFIAPFLRWI